MVRTDIRWVELSFREIPNLPPLFLDFLLAFERVAEFYGGGSLLLPLTEEALEPLAARARQVAARHPAREELCAILQEQNARWGAGEATREAIRELADSETVAVVTGQQPGLFTGPLFTLYKAWTAVSVCRSLRAHGVRAVPIFWIHSEDHDLSEATSCSLLGRDGEWVAVHYAVTSEEEGKPVGEIPLDERIGPALERLLRALPDSEFLPGIEALLKATYGEGGSLSEGFARLMARLSAESGLILLDPSEERFKRKVVPLWERVIREWPALAQALRAHSERLQARGYRPQIHPERGSAFLFVHEGGRRQALVWEAERFALRDRTKAFDAEGLVREIAEHPARFSPNVALRPLVQDALLPTLAYVGGPSEIAYFAQLGPLYAALDLPEPLLIPRFSLTLVEPRWARLLEKYGLALGDLLAGAEAAHQRVLERMSDADHNLLFEQAHHAVRGAMQNLRPLLRQTDPTLERSLERAEQKIHHQIERLRQQYLHARARQDEVLSRQMRRLALALAPQGSLQERAMNIFYFLARYGEELLSRLCEPRGFTNGAHLVVYL